MPVSPERRMHAGVAVAVLLTTKTTKQAKMLYLTTPRYYRDNRRKIQTEAA